MAIALAGAFVVAGATAASAHASAVATSPADGSVLDEAPSQLVVKFSERVEVATAAINLETAAQRLVQKTRPTRWQDDPTALVVPIKQSLRGSYVVFWRVVGEDNHVISGAFSFAVQVPGGEAVTPPLVADLAQRATTQPRVQGALTASRFVTYSALSALVGGVFLLVVVWPAGIALVRMRRFLWLALGIVSVATAVSGSVAYIAATGRGLSALASPAVFLDSVSTHYGWIAAVRLVLLGLAALLLADIGSGVGARSVWWLAPAALVGAGLVRTPGLVDHGATASPIESAAYFLHMGAITVWVGGLIVIAAVVLPSRAAIPDVRSVLLRFSAVATFALVLVVASGVLLASPLVSHWRTVPSSEYGQLLFTKLVLVGGGVAIAGRVRRWIRIGDALHSRQSRLLLGEVALVISVIAVTAVLVGRNPSPVSTPREPTSITQKGTAGGITSF